MRKRAINKMDMGKGIGKISRLPDFVLGIMGKLDARKGTPGVPDAMLGKMLAKCAALEKKEATRTVKRTEKIRNEATAAAVTVKRNYKKSDLQMLTGENGILSPYDIRENSRRTRKNNEKHTETDMAVKTLIRCSDELEHAESVLRERIEALRSKSFGIKANAYIKGVRKGKLPEYKPEIVFDDKAFRTYKETLGDSDELIFTLVKQIRKGEITV